MEKDKNVIGKSFGDEEIWDYIPTETDYNAHPEKIGSVNWQNGKPVLSFSSLCETRDDDERRDREGKIRGRQGAST